jgi:hypothetical protein
MMLQQFPLEVEECLHVKLSIYVELFCILAAYKCADLHDRLPKQALLLNGRVGYVFKPKFIYR